jgi:selenocysteine lyase/cysteine desulfurase
LVGAPLSEYDIIFTSGTTEAINLAAESLGKQFAGNSDVVVLSSLLEHSSNDLPWRRITPNPLLRLSINQGGFFNPEELETLLREYNQEYKFGSKRIRIVALSGASNVLGTYNNLEEISRIVHRYDARFLVDAAQLIAHRKLNMKEAGIDYLAFSGHKIYAPFGSGALIARKEYLQFNPGVLEAIRTSGEENIAGIAAMGKSMMLLRQIGLDVIAQEEQKLTIRTLQGFASIKGLKAYGVLDPSSPEFANRGGVIVFSMKGLITHRVARELAERNAIGVRSGCHCAHILIKHLLGLGPAMQNFQGFVVRLFPSLPLAGLVRVSFGIQNTAGDVDSLIQTLLEIADKTVPVKTNTSEQIKQFTRAVSKKVYS